MIQGANDINTRINKHIGCRFCHPVVREGHQSYRLSSGLIRQQVVLPHLTVSSLVTPN